MAWGGALFLACLPVFPLAYFWARRAGHDETLGRALRLGCWGGFLGTIGYDVVRIPFHLQGFRVFAPIQTYGVWLLDADRSSAVTDAVGWLYHFSNGITFGLMYALWFGGRHWLWGVLWGLCLESIVLATPFARIFHLQGNWPAIAIAYGAHVFYGFPLGYVVRRWQAADRRFSSLSTGSLVWISVLLAAFLFGSIPGERSRDQRAENGSLKVEGKRLNPTWVRLPGPGSVQLVNPGTEAVTIVDTSNKRSQDIPAGAALSWQFDRPGIYQCYVKTRARSISSFVIVEPVEAPP